MIDTDKYKGHTRVPWTWRGETIDGDGEVNHTVCYMEHPHVNGEMNEADARLIADAPLLLAEVKRLRGWIEQAVDVWKTCNYVDRTDWFNNFCEVMGDEEE